MTLLESGEIFWWFAAIYFGLKAKWFPVFFLGLIYDLTAGGIWGISSLKFLAVALVAYLIEENWPLRLRKQLSLRFGDVSKD